MNEAARATTFAVDREWNYAEGVVRTLSASARLADEDFARFYGQAQVAILGRANHTALIDSNGQQILNTVIPFGKPIAPPLAAARTRVREVLLNTTPQVFNLVIGRATGKPIVTIEFPVTVASGRQLIISEWF